MATTKCDKCGKSNSIANWSNYCPPCRDDFQKRCANSYNDLSAAHQEKAKPFYTPDLGDRNEINNKK